MNASTAARARAELARGLGRSATPSSRPPHVSLRAPEGCEATLQPERNLPAELKSA
ncbi:MAG TPA: hypothetical protein VFI41_12000 [Gemmatimonadales bacterium]|nr:hypothetical protein [Gemmatimonadales bacterium]